MDENKGLHLLYKNLGETPNETILRFKKENSEYENIPMTYAGRLDPMAEGLLLVLSGERLVEKDKYLSLNKTYEFEILWGFETDTLDILGLVKNESEVIPTKEDIKELIKQSKGKFEQKYPNYSSKPVSGKPLFQWAREGRTSEISVPSHEVNILESAFIYRDMLSGKELLSNIELKISLVNGDFRQKEIINKWKEVLINNPEKKFIIDKTKVVVSSGFYVRQFVSDIAQKLGTKAIAFHIIRTKIGEFANLPTK